MPPTVCVNWHFHSAHLPPPQKKKNRWSNWTNFSCWTLVLVWAGLELIHILNCSKLSASWKSSWMELSLMKTYKEFKSVLKFCKMRELNLNCIIVSSVDSFDRCDTCSPHSPCSPPGWFGQPSTSIPTSHNICFFGNPDICSSNTYRSKKRGRQQADWRRSECASWKWTGQWTGAAKCQCKWWKTNGHAVKG